MLRNSDLSVENFGLATPLHSSSATQNSIEGFNVIHSDNENGRYHTIISGKIWQATSDDRKRLLHLIAEIIRKQLSSSIRILFCGAGNPGVSSDSLGSKIAERLIVTGEKHTPNLFAIRPGIPSRTGIDTAEYLRCIAEMVHPDTIIVGDSLSASSREHLQCVIQISDRLTPGSALAHTSGEISANTMPCPVISIGVPTVISTAVFDSSSNETLFVTRAESDIISDCYASIIAGAINSAVFGK